MVKEGEMENIDIVGADEILPNLFLGSITSIIFLNDVKEEYLSDWCIVSVLDDEEATLLCRIPDLCHEHILLDIKDEPKYKISENFDRVNDFISWSLEHKKKVLVHCTAGISRSTTLVCAYLMAEKNITAKKALDIIRKQRSQACPNSGFRKQLSNYERHLTEVRGK